MNILHESSSVHIKEEGPDSIDIDVEPIRLRPYRESQRMLPGFSALANNLKHNEITCLASA